jgi:cardiolipin synthase
VRRERVGRRSAAGTTLPATARAGTAGPAVAGAIRIGDPIGAAFSNRRVSEAVEAHLFLAVGLAVLTLAFLLAVFPG